MRCRRAKAAIGERTLGLLGTAERGAFERHLSSCAACRSEAEFEVRVAGDLALLRGEILREIDIAPMVMARLERAPDVNREEVPARQLGFAAAAAVASGVGLLWALFGLRPEVSQLVRDMKLLAASLGTLLLQLVDATATLLAVPFKLVLRLLQAIPPVLQNIQPVAITLVAVAAALMAVSIVFILGRDFKRAIPVPIGGPR